MNPWRRKWRSSLHNTESLQCAKKAFLSNWPHFDIKIDSNECSIFSVSTTNTLDSILLAVSISLHIWSHTHWAVNSCDTISSDNRVVVITIFHFNRISCLSQQIKRVYVKLPNLCLINSMTSSSFAFGNICSGREYFINIYEREKIPEMTLSFVITCIKFKFLKRLKGEFRLKFS